MEQILSTHVGKWKNETYWNYSKNGGAKFNIVRTFVGATVYPSTTIKKNKNKNIFEWQKSK
jgi:hypothetical protein